MDCVLAVDHGTSGMKVSLVSMEGQVLATASEDLPTLMLPDGGVEQDPEQWWRALVRLGRTLVDSGVVEPDAVRAIGVSSTFSSTVPVDRDGNAVHNCITWMDGRGAPWIRDRMDGFPRVWGYSMRKLARWLRRKTRARAVQRSNGSRSRTRSRRCWR